ncbi:MAG: hypothetical protein UX02_C0003G0028 [Candidatus Moranbacteria bacterium GW2011_GWC1_45_18]|nr:MAG: hypothetical protein UT79_C0004G0028 [Candidatus Moranbacteria bacterium GW2011_GWC2_40_12]KKT33637.1 MAG: hypothetical protein UW19_C0007G0028 [Candidatus Moranbacteria bacterium GW2011_GWF2_44_10]KKT99485.1 MAG: hypothetical protein UX02_C0003G0028 [Candidatus Moranbacteria bacterium GW2011_GWC1_45_18]
MQVIVFEETHDVFGPFKSLKDAEGHLKESGFTEVSPKHWANGDAYVRIKTVKKPRK